MNLYNLIKEYEKSGYKNIDAISKVAQDIILLKISKSPLSRNVTIKGGVVMHCISNDLRRATRDLDLDFIRYSLDDISIIKFIEKLNNQNDNISINIIGKITELKQQDYNGKRVLIKLKDNYGYEINTKLDIGVHKDFDINQDEYCFNLNVLDFYYLINNCNMNKDKLNLYFKKYIFDDENMYESNVQDIHRRLEKILNRKDFKNNFKSINNNWLELPIEYVIENILKYILQLEAIKL